jgi:uncharacterized membrane protein YhaH (DUF805 family)
MQALFEATSILLFIVLPLVLGAYLNKLPTGKMRGVGFVGLCLLGVAVYTAAWALHTRSLDATARTWWLAEVAFIAPIWCGAAVLGFLIGGFMRPPKA